MYDPRQLGRRLREHRETRGLSAYAAARLANLSTNYYRLMERGIRRPSAACIAAIQAGLHLTGVQAAELRRLAGIDPDPGATPEARAARRAAWRELLFVYVNHLLLPRLELSGTLSGRDANRALFARAAESDDVVAFCDALPDTTRPPRRLLNQLEKVFGTLSAGDIGNLANDVRFIMQFEAGSPTAPHYRGRVPVTFLIAARSDIPSRMDAIDFVENFGFDRSFAVRFFPHLYAEACRCWPFSKVHLPLGRLPTAAQEELYNEVKAGLSVADLDTALLGGGPLGSRLAAQCVRPTIDTQRPGFADQSDPFTQFELDAARVDGLAPTYRGPPPRVDALFDHLDRSDFLDRFPMLKLCGAEFVTLATSLSLPSWDAWVADLRSYVRPLPEASPPFADKPLVGVLPPEPLRGWRACALATTHLSIAYADAVERAVSERNWPALLNAARHLPVGQSITNFIQHLAGGELPPSEA